MTKKKLESLVYSYYEKTKMNAMKELDYVVEDEFDNSLKDNLTKYRNNPVFWFGTYIVCRDLVKYLNGEWMPKDESIKYD